MHMNTLCAYNAPFSFASLQWGKTGEVDHVSPGLDGTVVTYGPN